MQPRIPGWISYFEVIQTTKLHQKELCLLLNQSKSVNIISDVSNIHIRGATA